MTLHVYENLEQRSDEWFEVRRGIVTASTVGQLLTPTLKVANNDQSRGLTALLVAERITGQSDPTWMSSDMLRGVDHEPIARGYYAQHHAPVEEVGFLLRDEPGWRLGWSPDGLVGTDGALEIKCPRAKTHIRTILDDAVPPQYMAQCMAALFVSGRDWLDFVSFHAGSPLFVKRVHPDPEWFDAINAAVVLFEHHAAAMVAAYAQATEGLPLTERVPGLEMSL